MTEQKTEWEAHQEMRLKRDLPNLRWEAQVVNQEETKNAVVKVISNFNSDNTTIDGLARKIKLDLITNLLHGFEEEIRIGIRIK